MKIEQKQNSNTMLFAEFSQDITIEQHEYMKRHTAAYSIHTPCPHNIVLMQQIYE